MCYPKVKTQLHSHANRSINARTQCAANPTAKYTVKSPTPNPTESSDHFNTQLESSVPCLSSVKNKKLLSCVLVYQMRNCQIVFPLIKRQTCF